MSCEEVKALDAQPLANVAMNRRGKRLRRLFTSAVAGCGLAAAAFGCSGQELLGDYAGSHVMVYELRSQDPGIPNQVIPIEYMGIISVYRQGEAMEIDLSKTCTLKGKQIARNGISLDDDSDAKCMMKLRNIPSACRAAGNIPDVRLAFKPQVRIYLTKNQDITLEGDFEFHSSEAVPCRADFVKASYTFKGTASQL
jgi:hypothetical protein